MLEGLGRHVVRWPGKCVPPFPIYILLLPRAHSQTLRQVETPFPSPPPPRPRGSSYRVSTGGHPW